MRNWSVTVRDSTCCSTRHSRRVRVKSLGRAFPFREASVALFRDQFEWLEADGWGGFASWTASGVRTRRYQGWLVAAAPPPSGRFMLVNGAEMWVRTADGTWPLSTHLYQPGVRHPDGERWLTGFQTNPWPTWRYRFPTGLELEFELFVPKGSACCVVCWTKRAGPAAMLHVRPLFSGRDYHSLHHENAGFRFDPEERGSSWTWRPYTGVPATTIHANADYVHSPNWYHQFLYSIEHERGLDDVEDLASPGEFCFDLTADVATMILEADVPGSRPSHNLPPVELATRLRHQELQRRSVFRMPLERAADAYIVRRGAGQSVIAGYPWFTDWGRDTFIAIRGLCLATGRLDDAGQILLDWSRFVSEGMLPNRFPDQGDRAEYNSIDAALWYVVVVEEFFQACEAAGCMPTQDVRAALDKAVMAILDGYTRGTRFGIQVDQDGLLKGGAPGTQLTWMDAKVGDRVITPRWGKPVEVNALWLNALGLTARRQPGWRTAFDRGCRAFGEKFLDRQSGGLFDVVDVEGIPGRSDSSLRPNQVFALGGLPIPLVDRDVAKAALSLVENHLLTPFGLRTLSPLDAHYVPHYRGGPCERDSAYHQGTVWPWLLGPFVDAWLFAHGDTAETRRSAQERFLKPLLELSAPFADGHIAELADAAAPHHPRGAPFQAWSVGEALRIQRRLATVPASG